METSLAASQRSDTKFCAFPSPQKKKKEKKKHVDGKKGHYGSEQPDAGTNINFSMALEVSE